MLGVRHVTAATAVAVMLWSASTTALECLPPASPYITSAVSVRVWAETGSDCGLLAGADVAVMDASGKSVVSAKTDENGHVALKGLPIGEYSIQVKKEGLPSFSRQTSVRSTSEWPGQTLAVLLRLGGCNRSCTTLTQEPLSASPKCLMNGTCRPTRE